ncbi:hypothetical protein [Pediococcus acidilactici]|nr:hypothetical protein [Pediococcus acidilactici]QHM53355.1 hypothetical protein C7M42_00047 [Pediococcus acidilactici]
MNFLAYLGLIFIGMLVDRLIIFIDDPKDDIKYIEEKKKGNSYVTKRN